MLRLTISVFAIALLSSCNQPDAVSANSAGPTKPATKIEAPSGPFGIPMGTRLESLKLTKLERPGYYTVEDIPRPHSDFESVVVVGFPETGVCTVRGIGITQDTDMTGTSVRSIADRVSSQLKTKYGEGKPFDKCGGYLCNPMHWSMEVMNGERAYSYEWNSTESAPLPDSINDITVAVQTTNLAQPYVVLEYNYKNQKQCKAEADKAGAASL